MDSKPYGGNTLEITSRIIRIQYESFVWLCPTSCKGSKWNFQQKKKKYNKSVKFKDEVKNQSQVNTNNY